MLLKHTAYYALSRGVPGAISFAALAIFTRLLEPSEFGRFALVVTAVSLANVVLFQWLRLYVARSFAARWEDSDRFLSEVSYIFGVVAVGTSAAVAIVFWFVPEDNLRLILIYSLLLLVTQAAFELVLMVAQSAVRPFLYGALMGFKAIVALAIGVGLAALGAGAIGPILGLVLAQSLAVLLSVRPLFRKVRIVRPSNTTTAAALRYGLPLTGAFALSWIMSGSDRLIIASLMGESQTGIYSAGYDLAFNVLTLLLVVVNTASYPLAVKALETSGEAAAVHQIRLSGEAVFTLALAGASVLIILARPIINLLLGDDFRDGARLIFPWLVMSTAAAGLKAYYFDFAFQLSKSTHLQMVSVGVAAALNIVLNLLLIPRIGLEGAAIATLAAYLAAMLISVGTGRGRFPMPPLLPILAKASLIAACTGAACAGAAELMGGDAGKLVAGLVSAGVAFLLAAAFANLCDCRSLLQRR